MDETRYKETFTFLKYGTYPDDSDKDRRREIRKKSEPYLIQGEALYHIPRSGVDEMPKKVVLLADKGQLIQNCHLSDTGKHLGKNKTLERISEKHYWKGMRDDVTRFIKECPKCESSPQVGRPPANAANRTTDNSNSNNVDPVGVWKLVGMDLMGPFPKTRRGNQFVCGLTDCFSEWPVVEPILYKAVDEVALILIKIMCTYGCFTTLITDQDQDYVNHLNSIICEKLNLDHEIAAAYNQHAGGLQKHFNPKLEHDIQKFACENPHDWDLRLNEVLFSYRTARHNNTGLSPFYVMFGREPKMPNDFSK